MRARTFVERRLLGGGEQDERLLERAGAQHRLRGGQRAHPAPRRVRRQRRRSLQERRRRGQAPARLRPSGRALELVGHRLVGTLGSVGAMPRAAVRIQLRIDRAGERPMDIASLGRGRGPVDG